MTFLPAPAYQIKARPDLSEYEPPCQCAYPKCQLVGRDYLELHHVVRRSAISGPVAWVEIGGVPVGNLVFLCPDHHRELTENKARVEWYEGGFEWIDGMHRLGRLAPHPPLKPEELPPSSRVAPAVDKADVGPAYSPSVSAPQPGEKCPSCGRRVNHPKTDSSPRSTTVSLRLPTDDKESFLRAWDDRLERLGLSGRKYARLAFLDIAFSLVDAVDEKTLREIVKDYTGRSGT